MPYTREENTAYCRQWRAANREKVRKYNREYQHAYWLENKAKIKAQRIKRQSDPAYKARVRDRLRAYQREYQRMYRLKNSAKIAAKRRQKLLDPAYKAKVSARNRAYRLKAKQLKSQ